jgi:hypothetical protein
MDTLLRDRHAALIQLKSNLVKAQERMKKIMLIYTVPSDHFFVGDWIYLKLQPY